MRIIAGSLGGRTFADATSGKVRPMSEKVRAALFNMLGDIEGLRILDAYGGTGAISFEAISRGAEFVQTIEKDRGVYLSILANAAKLQIENIKITQANSLSWSQNITDEKFDVIICDPPFDKLNLSTLDQLATHLKSSSIMVVSHTGREATPSVNGVVVVDNRNYGDAALSIYRKA